MRRSLEFRVLLAIYRSHAVRKNSVSRSRAAAGRNSERLNCEDEEKHEVEQAARMSRICRPHPRSRSHAGFGALGETQFDFPAIR
jgi:hypothetical protein